MSSHYEAPIRKPLIAGDKSYHDISIDIAKPIETPPNRDWWIAFTISLVAFLWGVGCIIYTIGTGIGSWGLNKTIGWAWDITNFVWWIGIGHAGTLISDLSVEQRMTICNMTIEGGARAGLIQPDEKIFNYLKGKPMSPKNENWDKALKYWNNLKTDEDAKFDKEEIELLNHFKRKYIV